MAFDQAARGVYPIAVTPFLSNGDIDYASIDRMVAFYEDAGADGLTILGVLGEAPKLTGEESLAVARRVISRTRLPIVVGASAPGFAAMAALSRGVMDAGAAGVMIAPAPTLRADDTIVAYFHQAVEAIGADSPWALQDYPLLINVEMAAGVIRRIVNDLPSCVMLKHEDWPGLEKLSTLRGFERDGSMRRIAIFVANGGLFLDCELGRGADGSMTGYAFPDVLVALVRHAEAGRIDALHDLFDAHLPLLRYEQQPRIGLAVRKYVLMRRGAIASDAQRKPTGALSARGRAEVEFLLARLAARDPSRAVLPLKEKEALLS